MDRDKMTIFIENLPWMLLPSFGSFGKAVSEQKIFKKSINQKQDLSLVAMFINGSGRNQKS
jgi:hypothetical protein